MGRAALFFIPGAGAASCGGCPGLRLFHYELIDADNLENNAEAGQASQGPLGLDAVLPEEEQSGGHAQEIPVDDDRERSVLAGQIIKTEDRQCIQEEKRMVLQALDKEDEKL